MSSQLTLKLKLVKNTETAFQKQKKSKRSKRSLNETKKKSKQNIIKQYNVKRESCLRYRTTLCFSGT